MAYSNYGVILKKGATTVGALTNIDFPKISTGAIESTNHASSGVREWIPDGLLEAEKFTATIVATLAGYNLIKSDLDAGTFATYNIDFTAGSGITDWSFSCAPLSIELGSADAQSPELLEMTVEFRPSGTITF